MLIDKFINILKDAFKDGVTMGRINDETIMIKGELDLKKLEQLLNEEDNK